MSDETKSEEYLENLLNSLKNEESTEANTDNNEDIGISDNENILNDDAPDSSIVDRDIAANMFSADNNINKSLDITDDMTLNDNNNINLDDILDNTTESPDIEKIMNDLNTMSDNSDDDKNMDNEKAKDEKSDVDNVKNSDIDNKDKKKKSLFGKIFSKKSKKEKSDLNEIDADEILDETGSTSDDMADFDLNEFGFNGDAESILRDLDELDDIEDKSDSKKKEKKEKKEKKARKPKKEKKIKQPKIKTKKEKPKRREEIIRISPLAIILMITVIALLVGGIYIGSNVFSYNSNIKEATNSYIDNDYTKAYNLLAGMKLKDKDKDFYKQVENIMKVEKHINDFNSFITIEKYTYALEALIRGIESYDENIEASKELGTYEILETEMNEIDTLLKNYFGMSIEDARTIIQITDSGKYAKEINERAAKINIVAEE
ncbi:hypothetical protein [Bovifimicola ammoniilytica]|uniref:hypothetical protein n=1 Tax=Bovifimicola ammoniilytica TaxID=2981720 RepID=UPI00033F8BC7|nr:hypothetical protein [Bovifimicola ammoniilytica]MCU6753325.1 hypothetical protein [Bovifimicola ammoniilytica]CCZ04449.1 putative uncharacterized protein [Eubacterium sp. CAG:603]SCJ59947.1 Uncharacterised protein [uncultured Eubacterium sp.]